MAKNSIKPLTGNAGDFSGIVLKAAARGDWVAVKHYLKINPAWLNQEGPHGRTLLWEATYKGRTDLVKKLISLGADVNGLGSYYTPLLVELTPLALARKANRTDLVKLLEDHGATDDLYSACYRGDLDAINKFLSHDPEAVNRPVRDVEPHPRMGYHPIHYAVVGHQSGALRLLVGYGARVNEHLPLLTDWAESDQEIIRYLKTVAKQEGPLPKHTSSDAPDADKYRHLPAIDRPDWLGFPKLVDACRGNHNATDDPERVLKLLKRGANINITDYKGKTPLHRACQAGFIEITNLLFERGADIEAVDDKGCTPVFDAAAYGRNETLLLLIDWRVNLAHTDARGDTPLFAAARGGHDEAFEIILNAGSDPEHSNKRGQTVLDVVERSRKITAGRKRILKLLKSAQPRKHK